MKLIIGAIVCRSIHRLIEANKLDSTMVELYSVKKHLFDNIFEL